MQHPMEHSMQHPATASPLRLTRRGRLVVVTLLALLICTAFLMGRSGASAATDTATDAAPDKASAPSVSQTTVRPGETLWAVAKRVSPKHDPRALVDEIRALNHLSSASLTVGQQLLIPRVS